MQGMDDTARASALRKQKEDFDAWRVLIKPLDKRGGRTRPFSPMSVDAQKVSVRNGETSLLPRRATFANSACFTCDAKNLAGEERRRMRETATFSPFPSSPSV